MSAHTPGPWIAHQRPAAPIEYGHHVTTHDGLTVCNVTYQLPVEIDGKVVEATRIANARLIAAAPDLLAALQCLLDAVQDKHVQMQTGLVVAGPAIDQARAAIAKATGGTP
jgi:hypothetical protein